MVKNIGVDIAEVQRFRKLPYKSNSDFYKKIFTEAEIKYCSSKDDPYPHFTARFAAKEAVLKALSSTIYKIKGIEILNKNNGAPFVKTKAKGKFLLSLSHTKNQAIAFVIWLS